MILTYATLCTYMYLINITNPFLNAIVPTLGFNLSTWSLSWVQHIWIYINEYNNNNVDVIGLGQLDCTQTESGTSTQIETETQIIVQEL